jgi:glycosyltransferase involved in cell wall biosynthesis
MAGDKPRVLQIVTHLALGGAERIALNLVHGLRDRFEFGLLPVFGVEAGAVGQAMKRELNQLQVPVFDGTRMPMRYGGMLSSGIQAARAVKRFAPDVIHVHTEMPEAAYLAMTTIAPGTKRIGTVRTVHNTTLWGKWHRIGLACDRRLANALVACVSKDALAAFFALRAASKAPAGPAPQLIYNGVIVPQQAPRSPSAGVTRVLFAGRLEDQKGADLLPAILRAVVPPGERRHELVIYGSGQYEGALRELAARPPGGWNISLNGPIADLSAEMAKFDLMIMPSRFEGLSLVAIEAAMLKLPVVATSGPGLREVFPETHPWLAQPGDTPSFAEALQRALDDPGAWTAAADQAFRHAQRNFDLGAMCDAYAGLYRRAAAA